MPVENVEDRLINMGNAYSQKKLIQMKESEFKEVSVLKPTPTINKTYHHNNPYFKSKV